MDNIIKELESLAIPIDSVKLDERNARQHPEANLDAIRRSLEHYGQRKPIVVRQQDMIIEAGNGLWMAARELGWDKVAAVMVEDDPTDATGYAIMDNQSALLAEWDFPVLKDLLEEQDTGAFNMDLTGFDQGAMADLMSQFHQPSEGNIDDDEVPEPTESICKRGDLWKLGNHRLLCGDATVITDVDKLMGGEKATLLLTDPPYGVDYKAMANDNLRQDQGAFWRDAFTLCPLVGDAYIFSPSGPPITVLATAIQEAGIEHHQWLVWAKHQFAMGRAHYHYRHEHIFYGWKGKSSWGGSRTEDSVWDCERPLKSPEHPTMKPVALCERALTNSSKLGQIVLDSFGGSGSTLIACEKLDRRCYMMEIDEHYCDVIIERWEQFTGKKAELIDG